MRETRARARGPVNRRFVPALFALAVAGGDTLARAAETPGQEPPAPDTGGQEVEPLRVTFLGTGAPPPSRSRMGPSTLVEAGRHKLLFDVGRGASASIRELGLPLGAITGVFFTHLHPDHVVGLPDLWLTGHHLHDPFAGRSGPLRVWGPAGTARMLAGLEEAYAGVAATWDLSPGGIPFDGHEFSAEGVVFEDGKLRVTAFRVPHGNERTDAYGYRIDFGARSVVISGDTGYSERLIERAAGVDVLIHEILDVGDDSEMDPAFIERLRVSHTVPEAAGRVFDRVSPRLAVAYHLGNPDDRLDEIEEGVRSAYSGPFMMAEDLVSIEITADSVKIVERP